MSTRFQRLQNHPISSHSHYTAGRRRGRPAICPRRILGVVLHAQSRRLEPVDDAESRERPGDRSANRTSDRGEVVRPINRSFVCRRRGRGFRHDETRQYNYKSFNFYSVMNSTVREPKFGGNQNSVPQSITKKPMEVYYLDELFVITPYVAGPLLQALLIVI